MSELDTGDAQEKPSGIVYEEFWPVPWRCSV